MAYTSDLAILDLLVHSRERREVDRAVGEYWRNRPRAARHGNRAEGVGLALPYSHGLRRGYKSGCRCRPCADAQSAYASAARRARLERAA